METTIKEIYNNIFDFLASWHNAERGREIANPYFILRNEKEEGFKRGLWFPGSENSIAISFWEGGDTLNKSPNIYFEVSNSYGCRLVISSKDSKEKYNFLSRLVTYISARYPNRKFQKKDNQWIEVIFDGYQDYEPFIRQTVANYKVDIDEYLQTHLHELGIEEYGLPLGFIVPADFDEQFARTMAKRNELINQNNFLESIKLNKSPHTQFALCSFQIENYQGIKKVEVQNIPFGTNWVFITGENGFGKTTLLQALAICLCNDSDLENSLNDNTYISCTVDYKYGKDYLIKRKGSYTAGANLKYIDHVLGYGPSRLNAMPKEERNQGKIKNHVMGLFETNTLLKNVNYELLAKSKSNNKIFENLKQIILKATSGRIMDIRVEEEEVYFTECQDAWLEDIGGKIECFSDNVFPEMPLGRLAAGFKNIINFVSDIYIRLSQANDHLDYNNFIGVVIIDEIENHLHPKIQKELVKALSELFPKVQFIASTHSPIPLLGAPANSRILHVDRDSENGITIKSLDYLDFKNLLPNTLLTSPIFGFQEIKPIGNESIEDLNVDDSLQDTQFFTLVNKKLEEIEKMQNVDKNKYFDVE